MTAKTIKDEALHCRDRADQFQTRAFDQANLDTNLWLRGIAELYDSRARALEARLRPTGLWDAPRPVLKF